MQKATKFRFDCNSCRTRCDGKSKGKYNFKADLEVSENYGRILIEQINQRTNKTAMKESDTPFPDLRIETLDGKLCARVEVKVQQRTFMSIRQCLPLADLYPSEAVALNKSDLLRYFEQQKQATVPFYIVWVLTNRPCIVEHGKAMLFHQSVEALENIHALAGDNRTFIRKRGEGDVVNGEPKGVIVNYHFSLSELIAGSEAFFKMIDELVPGSLRIDQKGFGS